MKGRTTRMVLRAIIDLSEGYNVTIVGLTRDEARAIAVRALKLARALGIPCSNLTEGAEQLPTLRIRALNEEARFLGPRDRVHIDHAAGLERGVIRDSSRSVEG